MIAEGDEKIEWQVHPARERPLAFILVIIFLAVCGVAIHGYSGSRILPVVSIGILLISLQSFFFPTDFVLDNTGIEIRKLFGKRKRPWREFRIYYRTNKGIQVSTFPRPSWLDSYRGVFLILSGNREEVEKILQHNLDYVTHGRKKSKPGN